MARWRDIRSTDGELLYSIRACGRYSVWPEHGKWQGYHHAHGCPLGKTEIVGMPSGFSEAQIQCRDHLEQRNAEAKV